LVAVGVQAVSERELVAEHERLARFIADKHFLPNEDRDDLRQEAMLALLLALRAYTPERGVPLQKFVSLVVTRRVISAIKLARAEKRRAQNEAVTGAVMADGEEVDVVTLLEGGRDPADVVVEREQMRSLVSGIRGLSPLERKAVVDFVFCGVPYAGSKALDNALCRARTKLRRAA
jgi:RNA polymerase sporulation-specific sigma factor